MKKIITTMVATLLVITLIAVGASHPNFTITNVQIKGLNFTEKSDLATQCNALIGKHLGCLVLIKPFAKQLKSIYPAIESIQFKPKWPSAVEIQVIEKVPWVGFLTETNHYFVAKDGAILNKLSTNPTIYNLNKIIIIRGLYDDVFLDDYISINLVRNTNIVVNNINLYFPEEAMQIEFKSNDEIDIIKNDQMTIKIGSLDLIDIKLQNLKQFIKKYNNIGSKLEYIDLRIEDKIITKRNST